MSEAVKGRPEQQSRVVVVEGGEREREISWWGRGWRVLGNKLKPRQLRRWWVLKVVLTMPHLICGCLRRATSLPLYVDWLEIPLIAKLSYTLSRSMIEQREKQRVMRRTKGFGHAEETSVQSS